VANLPFPFSAKRREGMQVAPAPQPIGASTKNADVPRLKFEISGRISIKLSGNMKSCLSFRKSPDFFKFRTPLGKAGRKSKMRSGNCEFPSDFGKSGLTPSEESLVDRVYRHSSKSHGYVAVSALRPSGNQQKSSLLLRIRGLSMVTFRRTECNPAG
jgi:hypothetical protein